MNKKKIFAVVLAALAAFTLSISAMAEDISSALDLPRSEKEDITSVSAPPVSIGLDVIAENSQMAIAGICGEALNFSAERFACAMNISEIETVTVTSLPDAICGSLYLGSEAVSVGRRIRASELSLLTYEETDDGKGKSNSFCFKANDSAYEMTCNIFMIDEINYSPSVSLASFASLNSTTYKNVMTSGVMSAHDPEGDKMTFEIVRYPKNGRVTVDDAATGRYTYIPEENFTGEDSFIYVAVDIYGNYSSWQRVNLTVAPKQSMAVYKDLEGDPLHVHAIAMTECGIMNGIQVGDNYYFEADRSVSRAEFVVTAMNSIGIKSLPEVDTTCFYDDEKISSEMKSYISLAYSKGYISGKMVEGNLCFEPDEEIKLSESAVIISNMIGYAEPKVTPAFADRDSIPSFSGKAIESLYTLGVLELPDMKVGACEILTRGDMAKLLNKAMLVISQ